MIVFAAVNYLTGITLEVRRLDAYTFEVATLDTDCHDYVCATFDSALEAINYAIEHS